MRMFGVGFGGRIVVRIRVGHARPIGVECGCAVVKQQWFAIPNEPQVLVFSRLVDFVVQVLHHSNHRTVKRPEAELRHTIAFRFHLLHHRKDGFPFVPITDGIGDIHHQHIHARIGEHGHVLSNGVLIFAQKIARLGFAPMIHALRPKLVSGVQAGVRIGGKNAAHIRPIRALQSVVRIAMPRNVKDSHDAAMVGLDRPDLGAGRHNSAQGVMPDPGIGKQIAIIRRFRCARVICRVRQRKQEGEQKAKLHSGLAK